MHKKLIFNEKLTTIMNDMISTAVFQNSIKNFYFLFLSIYLLVDLALSTL